MFLFGFTFSSVPIAHRILSKTTDPNHSDDPISARQEFLAKHGLCDLIIRCMSDPKIDEATYLKVTEVGNNLLVGGNRFVQVIFIYRLLCVGSRKGLIRQVKRVFSKEIWLSQEITVTVWYLHLKYLIIACVCTIASFF